MSNDFSNDPQPQNPFASPPSEAITPPVAPITRTGMVCDGSCMDALRVGWDLMTRFFWPFVGYALVSGIIRTPADNLDNIIKPTDQEMVIGLWMISQTYEILVASPLSFGVAWVFLKAARYEPFTLNDIFGAFSRNYWHAVGAGFLKGLIILVGLLLLIVPGIYLLIKLAFVEYLVVDRKMGTIEAMKESWRMTDGREGTILGLAAMSVLVFLGGMLLCIVGVIPALNWIYASFAVLYHTYTQIDQPEEPAPRPASDNPFSI